MLAGLLAIPPFTARWISYLRPDLLPPEVFQLAGIVFVLFVVVNLLRFVLKARSVNSEVLCASVSAYLLLGLAWTFAYWFVGDVSPGAFSFNVAAEPDKTIRGFDGIYFSFITLCTVGYGDITPVSKVARMLAALEAITGLLYVAVLIARLVAMYGPPKENEN